MAIRAALACALFAVFGPWLLRLGPSTPAAAAVAACSVGASLACAVTAAVQRRRLTHTACWFLPLAVFMFIVSLLVSILFQNMSLSESMPFAHVARSFPSRIASADASTAFAHVARSFFYLSVVLTAIFALWEAKVDPGRPRPNRDAVPAVSVPMATYSVDDTTVQRIRRVAERLGKLQSHVVREAVAKYARTDRLSEAERLRMLGVLDCWRKEPIKRSREDVEAELREIRLSRSEGWERRSAHDDPS